MKAVVEQVVSLLKIFWKIDLPMNILALAFFSSQESMASWSLWEVETNLEVEANAKVEADAGRLTALLYLQDFLCLEYNFHVLFSHKKLWSVEHLHWDLVLLAHVVCCFHRLKRQWRESNNEKEGG